MQALALDFDGVISDSAPESFTVAVRTYADLRPDSRLALRPERVEIPDPSRLRADPLYRGFVELMPLGNRAEDYAVVLSMLERRVRVRDQAAYDAQRSAEATSFLEAFHERFYQERHQLSDSDPKGWHALLGPYPSVIELLRRSAPRVQLALATAKDRGSVCKLLRAYGIDDLFPDDRVLDKETGVSKRSHLSAIRARLELPYGDITFVDDKVNHLDSVSELGVRCALAAWGYNGPREQDLARRRGYLVCQLDDAERQLFR